ncbi:MAG TPA: hypothetical protein PKY59_06185 [Pyrinomonadaceae bacterium]|nr:hypothetical protein [Pyrinomonadaceae bacterium]
MKRFTKPILIFQTLYFGITTFALHFQLMHFWQQGGEAFWRLFGNWFPLLIIDLVIGFGIGFLTGGSAVILKAADRDILKAVILNCVLWSIFCFFWFRFVDDPTGRDAPLHVISPISVGFIGLLLALANLIYFALRTSKPGKPLL